MYRQKMMIKNLVIIFSLSILLSIPNYVSSEERIIMVTHRTDDTYYGRWLYLIYKEAFRRMNMALVYEYSPAKRASYRADNGEVDGELSRIFSYAEKHPNLVRVEESPVSAKFIAITTDTSIRLNGWETLRNTKYKVDYRRGIKRCEEKLSKIVEKEKLSAVTTPILGLRKLLKGRIDVFIDSDVSIIELLKSPEFIHSDFNISGVMEEILVYSYLHKRHKSLAPKLASVLRDMKEEKLIEKYRILAEKYIIDKRTDNK